MKKFIYIITLLFLTACDETQNIPSTTTVNAPTNTPVIPKPNAEGKAVHNSATCAIDIPKNAALVSAKENLRIAGWAYDGETMTTPVTVQVNLVSVNELNNKILDATRFKRPDLVTGLKNSSIEMAGVDLIIPANTLVPGKYDLVILQNGPNYVVRCAKGFSVEVVDNLPPVQAPVVNSEPVKAPTSVTKPEVKSAVSKKKAIKAKNIEE
jgi:hypothetical protein